MATVRRRIVAYGQVQGVYFRDGAQQEALRRGLTGWVRNRDDGTVEIEVQGEKDDVDDFGRWAEEGPEEAAVECVDIDAEPVVEGESRFEVR